MGDQSELRGMIVVITFLATLGLLIGLIPSGFLAVADETRSVNVPEYFESINLQGFAETINFTISNSSDTHSFQLGGYDFLFNVDDDGYMALLHQEKWWIFITGSHDQIWYQNGVQVSSIHTFWDTFNYQAINVNTSLVNATRNSFLLMCDHTQEMAFIDYNSSKYNSPYNAWIANDLWILLAMEFDQTNTSYNAWNIVGMLLFYDLPNVHWLINLFIKIPVWTCVAYISFILILRAIGAIFGGGA